jgi:hypothetical protein
MSSVSSCDSSSKFFSTSSGELQQQILALERLDLAPRPLESTAGSGDGAIDILGIAFGNRRKHLTCRRIERLKFLPEAASTHWPSISIFS